jgi:hypothetical protein
MGLEMIEALLKDKGIEVENYKNPLKGISQYEAIEKSILDLIKEKYEEEK